jgi:hypothetical protein
MYGLTNRRVAPESGRNHRTLPRETTAAQHRATLARNEGYSRVFAALRTSGASLNPVLRSRVNCRDALASELAVSAPLWFIRELFLVEELLILDSENEVSAALYTL